MRLLGSNVRDVSKILYAILTLTVLMDSWKPRRAYTISAVVTASVDCGDEVKTLFLITSILKDRPDAEKNCAWEFIKFTVSPEIQADWHTASGYYPVTKKAYDVKEDKDWVAKYPQFLTAVDQLHAAPNNRFTQGALTGVMPAARQRIENAIEEVLNGKATPQQALDSAAAAVTKLIGDYNKTVPSK